MSGVRVDPSFTAILQLSLAPDRVMCERFSGVSGSFEYVAVYFTTSFTSAGDTEGAPMATVGGGGGEFS